jgi:hypothetical protein
VPVIVIGISPLAFVYSNVNKIVTGPQVELKEFQDDGPFPL